MEVFNNLCQQKTTLRKGGSCFRSTLNRFASADSIVPNPTSPQSFNRYSYARNNAVNRIDPTGHIDCALLPAGECSNSTEILDPPSANNNPWVAPDLNNDGRFDAEDNRLYRQSVGEQQIIQDFLSHIVDPTDNAIGQFGGCNTIRAGCADYHPAVDAGGNLGDDIYSVAYGSVVSSDNVGGAGPNFGDYVVVEHDVYGIMLYSVYTHLDERGVEVGDVIEAGTVIGSMGNTNGQGANNVHLHFEIRTAVNVDLDADGNPFGGNYWADSDEELHQSWVDLGPIYGYHNNYPDDWTQLPAIQR